MLETAFSSLPSSSERSSSSALHVEIKEGFFLDGFGYLFTFVWILSCAVVPLVIGRMERVSWREMGGKGSSHLFVRGLGIESDDESRRVPEMGSGEVGGESAFGRIVGSVSGIRQAQVQVSTEVGQRKKGRGSADKEHKRLKRLLRNRISAQQARERKKAYLSELEVRVKDLERKNSEPEEKLSTSQNESQMLRQILKNTTASRRMGHPGEG